MSPCAACKLLRRRCAKECVFAPYFPGEDPQKFANAHKVFGASNINKILKEVPAEKREDAVKSMVYEANARIRDPVYGSVGLISCLEQQLCTVTAQLSNAKHEISMLRSQLSNSHLFCPLLHNHNSNDNYYEGGFDFGMGCCSDSTSTTFPQSLD